MRILVGCIWVPNFSAEIRDAVCGMYNMVGGMLDLIPMRCAIILLLN